MKLSTVMIAGAALMGAATVASHAAATTITVFEGYNYSSADSSLYAVATPIALSDLIIGATNFGAVAAGTYSASVGDNEASGAQGYVYAAAGSNSASGTFGSVLGDADQNIAATTQVGTLTLGVPEPASWALMLVGFAGLGVALRSSRKAIATA